MDLYSTAIHHCRTVIAFMRAQNTVCFCGLLCNDFEIIINFFAQVNQTASVLQLPNSVSSAENIENKLPLKTCMSGNDSVSILFLNPSITGSIVIQ